MGYKGTRVPLFYRGNCTGRIFLPNVLPWKIVISLIQVVFQWTGWLVLLGKSAAFLVKTIKRGPILGFTSNSGKSWLCSRQLRHQHWVHDQLDFWSWNGGHKSPSPTALRKRTRLCWDSKAKHRSVSHQACLTIQYTKVWCISVVDG